MPLNFEESFKITLCAMRINQSDPDIKRGVKFVAQIILLHGCYTMVFSLMMYNIIFVNLKEHDFSQTCKNGTLTLVFIANTFQYSVMLWKRRNLKILMDTVKRDLQLAKSLSVNEQKIINDFAMKGSRVCKQWLFLSIFGTGLFVVKNIILIIYYWVIDGEVRLLHLYDLVYPTSIEKRKDNIIMYSIIYVLILSYGCYSSVMFCAFVPLGPILMLHACGQLELVKMRIENLFNSDDLEEVGRKLKNIARQLQNIYEFVDRIKASFMVAYELNLKFSTITLPVTCYEVIESLKHGEVSLEFIIFIVGGVMFSSSPCFYGDLLMEKGEDVRLAMYSCGWEKVYDRGIRSTVGFILQRGLRPVAIRTLFRTVCLDALTDLFQQAYTLFNLMNAAWN